MRSIKLSFILVIILLSSCDYSRDKLEVYNKTDSIICFQTLVKNKKDSDYYQISAGGKIQAYSKAHPIVRYPISMEIKDVSLDGILYIVFHPCADKDYVYSHINELVSMKRYLTKKYSLKQLDTLNWKIDFMGK